MKLTMNYDSIDPIDNDVLETAIEVAYDWFSCPNVFMAIDDDMTEFEPLKEVMRSFS